ncbi:hypothetical protein JK2ML_0984 [Mycobacterium leprae Kyoto-2]|uniref:Limonene-1,2-epoxide hydrolase domain-containing protein n=2 Tax=Mycobacterium leprae TaxID=1769 RepID=Q9CCC2_MYCLE|nr:limonene-1,2-epoxide hydrolase family protein [Mycobacterium leprae]AWV47696.1 limonene-1,2-epoxide hydrolase [Mycobacterium leprae]BBC16892.1 hypothetical protein JK2ML_0984 [Mycobacterium leprae Kyoto-2]CAC31365.1 conserved hypothetical protein [Mycobacterium leprae]
MYHAIAPLCHVSPKLVAIAELTEASVQGVENIRTVEVFLAALQDAGLRNRIRDVGRQPRVYQNVGLPTIHGRSKTITLWRKMADCIGFEIKIHRIAAVAIAVLCERADAVIVGPLWMQFWVCGTFEVQNKRIMLWRNYFDLFDLFKATMRSLVALRIPSLNAAF